MSLLTTSVNSLVKDQDGTHMDFSCIAWHQVVVDYSVVASSFIEYKTDSEWQL